jgi:dTDP-4-dehydrorhamnose reductase
MTAPVLVCGRRGQVATDLVEAADALGLPLVALGRPKLDITDPDGIARALDRLEPAAVINAAAYTAVDRAEGEPDAAFALNRDGPAHLARACAKRGRPLIHLSTDQVFDGRKDGGYAEDDPPNPLCVYGASKLAGERAVLGAGGDHLSCACPGCSARPATTSSPRCWAGRGRGTGCRSWPTSAAGRPSRRISRGRCSVSPAA